jgi:hypothetical protein
MSQDVEPTIRWECYEAEILSRYVGQNYTLEDTMAYMRKTYGLNATYISPYFRSLQNWLTLDFLASVNTKGDSPDTRT